MSPPLSPAQLRNVAAVRALYACERERSLDRWCALWHPNGRQTFAWGGFPPITGIDALRKTTAAKFATRSDVAIDDSVEAMADEREVFAVAAISMRIDGHDTPLATSIWCRFTFDAEGRLIEQCEAVDTAALAAFAKGTS